jgi:hypothetical protein
MLHNRQSSKFVLPVLLALTVAAGEAYGQGTTAWKIATERDQLSDRVSRFAVTLPKSAPIQKGKSVTTALIIKCGSAFTNGPAHPELMVLFTSLKRTHMKTIATRYRFDEGPIRDYKLNMTGRNGAYAIVLPKFSDQDPIADLAAARRMRVDVSLPGAENTVLDFNVAGAADAVHALACQ